MLNGFMMAAAGVGGNRSLIDILTSLGLTTNLKLCLDAGDAASYTSGQSWLDRSGGGYDFFLGATGSANTDDPTFTGTAGGLSSAEYFSFDGGDYFKYDTTIETWMNAIHKAGFQGTIMMVYNLASANMFFANYGGASANIGFAFIANSSVVNFRVAKAVGGGTYALNKSADAGLSLSAWHMVAVSIDEAAGAAGGFFYADGAYKQSGAADTWNPAYATPSASAATYVPQIGADGAASPDLAGNGSRIAMVAAWQGGALTKANLDSIWAQVRGRFEL